MCGLARTPLTTSQKVGLSAAGLAGQGKYGRISEAAGQFEVSRETVYRAASEAEEVLAGHFASKAVTVAVDEAQLRRAIVALRVMAPDSLRSIEGLLPILYPGVKRSYGTVQDICAEAEAAAAAFNAETDLSGIEAAALDEMFSQGDPVLASIDLDGGYLFSLDVRDSRSTEDWTAVLSKARDQGVDLKVAVKDAASGIAKGVTEVFPEAEQRDDCFHALYAMGTVRQQLERNAFAAIGREMEAEHKVRRAIGKLCPPSDQAIQSLRQKRNGARGITGKKMALHDAFERASRRAKEAMELVDLERGILRDPTWMQAEIEAAAEQMMALSHKNCRRVGRYIKNRAPGLVLYASELRRHLGKLADQVGETNVVLSCISWRLMNDLRVGSRPWQRHHQRRHLLGAFALLQEHAGTAADSILERVDEIWQHRHRASSAIEGFNAFLRPFLYVQKGVTQGFLELLRAYYNLRTRRWGRHKGTSAHEVLRGESVDDWLTLLGYPPSPALA